MGRLSEFVNGSRGRSTYIDKQSSGDIEVSGFLQNAERLGRIMTQNPDMATAMRRAIRKELQRARKDISANAKSFMDDDPRKAANAVKYAVYKAIFGGNVSILKKKKAGARYQLIRPRKLDQNPNQRGGNRRPRVNDDRNRLETYYGADRGFILRFLASGTVPRETRYGNRGYIRQSNWFGTVATYAVDRAAELVADDINNIIKEETNG